MKKTRIKLGLFMIPLLLLSCGKTEPSSSQGTTSNPTTTTPTTSIVTPTTSEPTPSTSTSTSSSSSVERENPRILLENEVIETHCKAGEYIRLLKGYARDADQKDISNTIEISLVEKEGATIQNGHFKATKSGTYHVLYTCKDHVGKEQSLTYTLHVASWYENKNDIQGYDDISKFNETKEVRDNLENGSSLLSFSSSFAELVSDDRAIEGTSLYVDYNRESRNSSNIEIKTLAPYMKSGKWTIAFDVKVVKGYGFSDFYVGYKEVESGNTELQQISLSNLGFGETKHISYTGVINAKDDQTYNFEIMKQNQNDMDVALCFDNFSVQFEEVSYRFYTPTVEELHQGVTIDWNDKFLPITSTLPQEVSKIESEAIRNELEASDAFGETCLYMYGSGDHNITGIENTIDEDYFDTSMVYTFKFTYYAMSVSSHYLIVIDGSADNVNVASGFLKTGLNEVTISFQVPKNAKRMTFYGTYDMYVGKMEISLEKSSVNVRNDIHTPTHNEIIKEGGYTWDYSENNALDLGGFLFAETARLPEEVQTAIAGLSSFSSQVIEGKFINGGGRLFNTISNVLSLDYTYTLSFDAYCESGRTVLLLLYGNSQIGNHTSVSRTAVSGRTNIYHYSVTFTPQNGTNNNFKTIMLYPQATFTMYIGNITLSGVQK